MKKFLYFCTILLVLNACSEKSAQVEKIMEGGVEVVLNKMEPYAVKGEPAAFSIAPDYALDFERDDLAELGVSEVLRIAADSKGNVFCMTESEIFKFDSAGNFLLKFGTQGEGPGEFSYAGICWVDDSDRFVLLDWMKLKFLILDDRGHFLEEVRLPSDFQPRTRDGAFLLSSGGFLYHDMTVDREAETFAHRLVVLDDKFQRIAELEESLITENPFQSARFNLFRATYKFRVSRDVIYAYSQQNPDYEIRAYDLQGRLLRKIKKEYQRVPILQDHKDERLAEYLESTPYKVHKMQGYFPDNYPPISEFYVDTDGRIFVATYEEGETPGTDMVDIFDVEGVFTGRVSLPKAQSRLFVRDRLYSLSEKESGYQILNVYKMTWE